jgi:hypothetical protein
MGEESALIVIAEIAAALAGFSGIAATFGRRQERSWSPSERARLANLLNHSGIALFAALLPLVFAQIAGFTPKLWRISSFLWAAFASIGIGLQLRWALTQKSLPRTSRAFLALAGFAALLVFQLCNAVLWCLAWPYLVALVGNLGFAFVQFMGLVNPSRTDHAS